jgi:FkbM family methyltransferase
MKIARKILRHFLKKTGYELIEKQQRLPPPTFDKVKLVLALFSITQPDSTFVQIGAYDGQTVDPVNDYVLTGKMKCLMVEPIEASFQKLRSFYDGMPNVNLIQAAIGHSDGSAIMFKVKQASQSYSVPRGGLSSFDKAHLLRHKIKEQDIEQVQVPCLTLKTLLAKFQLTKVNILQIDTEGFDAEIVKMALALEQTPDCINFENSNLSLESKTEIYDLLTKSGYVHSSDTYNSLAMHQRLTEGLLDLCRGSKTLSLDS